MRVLKQIENRTFYREENLILAKYSHIKTPLSIQNDIARLSINSKQPKSDKETFWSDSLKFKPIHKIEASYENLDMDFPTFNKMQFEHRAWYVRWRGFALENEIIITDKPYIYLFAYELINYSFNPNAAFNISMLERLSITFERDEVGEILKSWLMDMLFEVEEYLILKKENLLVFSKQQINYLHKTIINNEMSSLTIKDWSITEHNNISKFSIQYKNEIEQEFLNIIQNLSVDFLNKYFEPVVNSEFDLFEEALIARNIEKKDKILLNDNDDLPQLIQGLHIIAENVVRAKHDFELIDQTIIPELKQLQNKLINYSQDRFVIVQESQDLNPSEFLKIPSIEDKDKNENTQINATVNSNFEEFNFKSDEKLKFDLNLISKNRNATDELIDFIGTDESEEVLEFSTDNAKLTYIEILGESNEIQDIEPFVKELNEIEIGLLSLFQSEIIEMSELKKYCKVKRQLPTVVLDAINEKAVELFGENIFEVTENQVEIYEDFLIVMDLVKKKPGDS